MATTRKSHLRVVGDAKATPARKVAPAHKQERKAEGGIRRTLLEKLWADEASDPFLHEKEAGAPAKGESVRLSNGKSGRQWRTGMPSRPLLEVPEAAAILGERSASRWLRSSVKELAKSKSVVGRVAAVGMLSRFSELAEKAGAPSQEPDVILSADVPGRHWFEGLSADDLAQLAVQFHDEADALEDAVEKLEELVGEHEEAAAAPVLEWLHQRDLLESVLYLAQDSTLGEDLAARLDRLDRISSNHHTTFMEYSFPADPWLATVAATDAELWWGALSGR